MAAEKFPAFYFFPRDWIAGTAGLSAEQKGVFIDLLSYAWEQTPPCTLPNDDVALARMAGMGAKKWKNLAPGIRAKFELIDGRLRNPKQWSVYQDQVAQREKKRQAGTLGNQKRWGMNRSQSDRTAIAGGVANGSPPSPNPSPSPDVKNDVIGESASPEDVDNWVSNVMRLANKGMDQAGINYQPILWSHGSRQSVHDWLADGVTPETIEHTVYTVAQAAKKQISSMKYFDKAVRAAHEREASARLEIPADSEAGRIKSGGRTAEMPRESAGRVTTPSRIGVVPEPRDDIAIAKWKKDHAAELAEIRNAAEMEAKKKSGDAWGMLGERTRQRMVDTITDQIISNKVKVA